MDGTEERASARTGKLLPGRRHSRIALLGALAATALASVTGEPAAAGIGRFPMPFGRPDNVGSDGRVWRAPPVPTGRGRPLRAGRRGAVPTLAPGVSHALAKMLRNDARRRLAGRWHSGLAVRP